ncbi:hypothetical protein LX36DRAFT_328063 [Colletotrichum falcatum]|nr:hypothetical protein LX36DRAFT_328063 [Colletotrichum falcatum]
MSWTSWAAGLESLSVLGPLKEGRDQRRHHPRQPNCPPPIRGVIQASPLSLILTMPCMRTSAAPSKENLEMARHRYKPNASWLYCTTAALLQRCASATASLQPTLGQTFLRLACPTSGKAGSRQGRRGPLVRSDGTRSPTRLGRGVLLPRSFATPPPPPPKSTVGETHSLRCMYVVCGRAWSCRTTANPPPQQAHRDAERRGRDAKEPTPAGLIGRLGASASATAALGVFLFFWRLQKSLGKTSQTFLTGPSRPWRSSAWQRGPVEARTDEIPGVLGPCAVESYGCTL